MAQVSSELKKRLAELYLDTGVLKFGEYTLVSGLESPMYIDTRMVLSYPEALQAVVDTFVELIGDVDEPAFLAGIPEGGTPLAAALGYELKHPLVQLRKVVKSHGTKNLVEGDYQEGDEVILIDDLITQGDSKFEAISQLEDVGLKLKKLVVILDRQQGGIANIEEAGHEIEAALTITELINILVDLGKVTHEQKREVLDFVEK